MEQGKEKPKNRIKRSIGTMLLTILLPITIIGIGVIIVLLTSRA